MRRISLCYLGLLLAGGCAFDGSEGSEPAIQEPAPPPEAPIATPLPTGGTYTISGRIASSWIDPPVVPIAEFGVVLVNKSTPALAPQDCFPQQVTRISARADRTFTIPNVASGSYYVLAYRLHEGLFERTSVDVTVNNQNIELTAPIQLLPRLNANIVEEGGRGEREVVTWRAPMGTTGFNGLAFRSSSADACAASGGELQVDGSYRADLPNNLERVRVLVEKGAQVAMQVEEVDGDEQGD
jgi:hypothetical protein